MMDGAVTGAARPLLPPAAARATLEPLGLARIDETTWVDDHGWWLVAADFETLRARGTRLRPFPALLWHPRERPARTVSVRVRRRGRLLDQDGPELACPYESDAHFAPLGGPLAARAGVGVLAGREGFPILRSWAAYLDGAAEAGGGLWRE